MNSSDDEIKRSLAGMDLAKWDDFASHLYYDRVDLGSIESFEELSKNLKKLEGKHNTAANKIFYLAIPPSAYGSVAAMLGKAGLSREQDGWQWVEPNCRGEAFWKGPEIRTGIKSTTSRIL